MLTTIHWGSMNTVIEVVLIYLEEVLYAFVVGQGRCLRLVPLGFALLVACEVRDQTK